MALPPGADDALPAENGDLAFPARTYCRAPKDDASYDVRDVSGPCFACLYDCGDKTELDDANLLDSRAARDGHGDITALIRRNYGQVSLKELVAMVHDHYETHVRPWVSHGEWSRRSISEHITVHMADDSIQINESITALYSQIDSLREICWYTEEGAEQAMPDLKNIKMLHDLVKTTAALIDTRSKRR